jgi:4-hydroxybenzoate polyprenyltransferase
VSLMYAGRVSAGRDTSWADAARALRARQWLHFTTLPAAAIGAGAPLSLSRLFLGSGVAASLLAYAYGANAIADRATDASARKNALAGVVAVPLRATGLVLGSGALALAGALVLGGVATAAAAIVLVVATVYSTGPRWKATPGLGTLLNALLFAPLALLAFDGLGAALGSRPLLVRVAAFVPMLLQNQLLHELADADEDARAGTLTSARVLGSAGVRAACVALGALGVGLAFVTAGPRVAALSALALAAMTAVAVAPKDAAAARAAHRRAGLVAGAIVFAASGTFT